jgi:hypothetical protein
MITPTYLSACPELMNPTKRELVDRSFELEEAQLKNPPTNVDAIS